MKCIRLNVWGDYACFTRPDIKAERLSYDVITPSAARGIIESIYWKPEIVWHIDRIYVINEIVFDTIKINEISKITLNHNTKSVTKNNTPIGIDISNSKNRSQRRTTLLRNVNYIIDAHFELIGGDKNSEKHLSIFNRRAKNGQHFQQPCMGCREFPAYYELIENHNTPLPKSFYADTTKKLGIMLLDMNYSKKNTPLFFNSVMKCGMINDIPRRL